ncbi:MAG: hypothetical protein ACT4O9_02480 [Blastocatellia bacterium]
MNDPRNSSEEPITNPDIDLTPQMPEPPAVKPPGEWVMPEPVFQQTSGYLPQGYIESLREQTAQTNDSPPNFEVTMVGAPPPAMPVVDVAPPSPVVEIEPQPDISEQFTVETEALPTLPEPKKSGSAGKIILVALAITALAFLGIVFLALIYYLFFAAAGESNIF